MKLNKDKPYGEIWGAAPVPGAVYTQDGQYFRRDGEPCVPVKAPVVSTPVVPEPVVEIVVEDVVADVVEDVVTELPAPVPVVKKSARKK